MSIITPENVSPGFGRNIQAEIYHRMNRDLPQMETVTKNMVGCANEDVPLSVKNFIQASDRVGHVYGFIHTQSQAALPDELRNANTRVECREIFKSVLGMLATKENKFTSSERGRFKKLCERFVSEVKKEPKGVITDISLKNSVQNTINDDKQFWIEAAPLLATYSKEIIDDLTAHVLNQSLNAWCECNNVPSREWALSNMEEVFDANIRSCLNLLDEEVIAATKMSKSTIQDNSTINGTIIRFGYMKMFSAIAAIPLSIRRQLLAGMAKPAVTQPAITQPAITQPTVTPPAITQPTVTPPTVTPPAITPPTVTPPTITQSAVTPPVPAKLVVALPATPEKPVVAKPATAEKAVGTSDVTDNVNGYHSPQSPLSAGYISGYGCNATAPLYGGNTPTAPSDPWSFMTEKLLASDKLNQDQCFLLLKDLIASMGERREIPANYFNQYALLSRLNGVSTQDLSPHVMLPNGHSDTVTNPRFIAMANVQPTAPAVEHQPEPRIQARQHASTSSSVIYNMSSMAPPHVPLDNLSRHNINPLSLLPVGTHLSGVVVDKGLAANDAEETHRSEPNSSASSASSGINKEDLALLKRWLGEAAQEDEKDREIINKLVLREEGLYTQTMEYFLERAFLAESGTEGRSDRQQTYINESFRAIQLHEDFNQLSHYAQALVVKYSEKRSSRVLTTMPGMRRSSSSRSSLSSRG